MFFLIGHRGVGKTTLVKNMDLALDLDAEISKIHKISSFFENDREDEFRALEHEVLNKILKNKEAQIVSLGAGFDLDGFVFPKNSKVIWVQRKSDKEGRVFCDRPRLNVNLSALDEYLERFPERQKLYEKHTDFCIELEEGGVETALPILKKILLGEKVFSSKAYYTLRSLDELSFFKGRVELRTDLLSENEIFNLISSENNECDFLVSFRTDVSKPFFEKVLKCKNIMIDVPMEQDFFEVRKFDKNNKNIFVSSHEDLPRSEIHKINQKGFHLKWAPLVESFEDLKTKVKLIEGLDVSFLPRSIEKGRWKWCRQLHLLKNKINFYRTGLSEYLDQPNLIDLDKPIREGFLGAVLGEDVNLSHSPFFHNNYFREAFQSSYLSISLGRNEFNKENLLFLKEVGLSFFSITAPFKKELRGFDKLIPANTMTIDNDGDIFTKDTDSLAVETIISKFKKTKVLIWGSGDIGKLFFKAFGVEDADIVSVRNYSGEFLEGYDTLLWCSGLNQTVVPEFKKPPTTVVDLEYKEQSPAREVALSLGCKYISGKSFFETQALAQQKFWAKKY